MGEVFKEALLLLSSVEMPSYEGASLIGAEWLSGVRFRLYVYHSL